MSDRGLAAYVAELVGTMFLVFIVTSAVVLYVATGANAQFGSDFAVVGLVHAFVLAVLVVGIGAVSGGHFNPAVTIAAAALRRIEPIDAVVYILAQLSGGVLGALMTKAFLKDEGQGSDYGATVLSPLIGGAKQGVFIEAIGAFLLVLTVLAVAVAVTERKDWAPWAIGITLGFDVMVFGPLTGGAFNPARWFGPALVGNEFADAWVYVVGPVVAAVAAAAFYKFVIAGGLPGAPKTSVAPGTPAGAGGSSSPSGAPSGGPPPKPPGK